MLEVPAVPLHKMQAARMVCISGESGLVTITPGSSVLFQHLFAITNAFQK